jgi:hypothetical protein
MSLRTGDAWDYLRLKSTFQESDSTAVYSDGKVLPVLIRTVSGVQQCAVEINDQLFEAAKVTGFQGFQKIPAPSVELPPASPEPTEAELFEAAVREEKKLNPGENEWILRRRVHARFFNQGMGALKNARQAQSNEAFGTLPDKWVGFAAAAKRARNSR